MPENKNPINSTQTARANVRKTTEMAGGMSMTPKEIVDILRRHLILITIFTFLGSCAGISGWVVLKKYAPKFTAKTYIEVLSPVQSDPSVIGTAMPNKDIAFEFRSSKATLIKQQGNMQELLKRDAIRDTDWFKKFDNDITKAIDSLKKHFGVTADRNSSYIIVNMTCKSPVESALIVNEMVDLFLRAQQNTAAAGTAEKLKLLRNQESAFREKTRSLNSSLAELRETSGITQLDSGDGRSKIHTTTAKLSSLEIEKVKLEADMEQIRTTVENYEKRELSDDVLERNTENDMIIRSLIQRMSNIEAELAQKQTNLGENHREVQKLKELLRQTAADKEARSSAKTRQLRQSDVTLAKDQLSILTNRMAKLEELRARTELEQRELDRTRATYDQLIADREETQNNLFAVQEQISKYNQIKDAAESSKVRSMGLAQVPLEMSSPSIKIFGPGGFMLGFMLGTGLAFLIELMNNLLKSPSDVIKHTNVPLLGMITHNSLEGITKKADMWRVVSESPFSIMSECYRQFRTNLKLSTDTYSQQVLFITSGSAEEGRTTVAVNSAYVFAAEGQRVLFIDTNFRRPTAEKIFHSTAEDIGYGLSGYLNNRCELPQLVRPSGITGIDVIDSGKLPENPAEILSGERMDALIKYAKENYDRIILDGPPMIVSDAKTLAAIADGTILVFNTAITKRGAAKRIARELNEMNANLLGAVLIGVKILKGGYFREMISSYHDYQKPQTAETRS
ncbi:MAG: polysaccharide biosynthesis tyrosine autokinase [Anaerohalosphaeraceae bacterium]|nr:polysaccharide biosynthesis tyrosine autokinase [Anaerohalosphaeraceae bacterium]